MPNTTLQELLDRELDENGESPVNIIQIVIGGSGYRNQGTTQTTYADLADYEGSSGFGAEAFPRLHAWTTDYVYFKDLYDGAENVKSVPRNPSDEHPGFYGGG